MKIVELASVVRSKNASPLWLTIDLMFETEKQYKHVLEAKNFNAESIARLYDVQVCEVSIIPYPVVNAIKVTLPRKTISGDLGDMDVYGCQQHMPLAMMEV